MIYKIKNILKKWIKKSDQKLIENLSNDLESAFLKWWKHQSSEMSKMLLIKENRIKHLEDKNEKEKS